MSKKSPNPFDSGTQHDTREEYASAFNQTTDPLSKFNTEFYDLPDPFEHFVTTVLSNDDNITCDTTIVEYQRTYRQWRKYMETTDRHPACPKLENVIGFIEWRRDRHRNSPRSIDGKLNRLIRAYEYWQKDSAFPHPIDYNPFSLAREHTTLGDSSRKPFPDVSLDQLRAQFAKIDNLRSRAVIGTQLKEGCRRGEICNLQIQDIHISHKEIADAYPNLGTNPALDGQQDAMYIPHNREGNKSSNPRLLPIDEELRWILIQYLTIRPNVDEPWVFLSKTSFSQLGGKDVNDMWKGAFYPQFDETEDTEAITSHFGRHWFSSHWRLNARLEREHVQYMRGDRIAPIDTFPDAIDDYLHPNYSQIEEIYRNDIFKLDLAMQHYVPK